MHDETLLYIEDDAQRKLFYRFTPASFISNFVPLIVILDHTCSDRFHNFEYKMWNVLTPLTHLGEEQMPSCWLGEKEDFYLKDLLQKLIAEIADAYECEDHIYLYGGSAIDGYGAILHGILCKANAVYAYAPHIRLMETKSAELSSDLTNFLNSSDRFPVFYLCDDETIKGNTPKSETVYFAESCKENDISVELDFCASGDDETERLKSVLDFFERVASER